MISAAPNILQLDLVNTVVVENSLVGFEQSSDSLKFLVVVASKLLVELVSLVRWLRVRSGFDLKAYVGEGCLC